MYHSYQSQYTSCKVVLNAIYVFIVHVQHGIHPRWLYATAYLPLILGPLYFAFITVLLSFATYSSIPLELLRVGLLINCCVLSINKYDHIQICEMPGKKMMTLGVVMHMEIILLCICAYVFGLSLIPHQELRHCAPLLDGVLLGDNFFFQVSGAHSCPVDDSICKLRRRQAITYVSFRIPPSVLHFPYRSTVFE